MIGNATKYPRAHQNPQFTQNRIKGIRRQIGIETNALTATLNELTNIWSLMSFFRKISGMTKSRPVGIIDTINRGNSISNPSPLNITANGPGL